MRVLAEQRPRFGYRRLHVLLRREGFAVNRKRVHRIYRAEGLAVRRRRRKRVAVARQPIAVPIDVPFWFYQNPGRCPTERRRRRGRRELISGDRIRFQRTTSNFNTCVLEPVTSRHR
jgi:transposase InsO family protein